jgi:4'-phosphopantetheinyl transferase
MNSDGPFDLRNCSVLADDEVRIWRIGLDLAKSDLTKLRQLLSPEEQATADQFHFEVDQRRRIIGRGSMRLLLGTILNLPANELQFEYDPFGKPHLAPGQRRDLHFNISHSGGWILLAITKGRAIGIDLEMVRTDLDVEGIATRFFSRREYDVWAPLAGQARYDAFFTCWTRKEAYMKANGAGLTMQSDRFDVSFLPGEEPRLLETRPDPDEALRWTLVAPQPEPGYRVALAVEGPCSNAKCLDFCYGILRRADRPCVDRD